MENAGPFVSYSGIIATYIIFRAARELLYRLLYRLTAAGGPSLRLIDDRSRNYRRAR
jgi:hypothetical protein